MDAALFALGSVTPTSHVTIAGKDLSISPDDSFLVPVPHPDRRQVLPVVASSWDGREEQTVVLAIERNMKKMQRHVREPRD